MTVVSKGEYARMRGRAPSAVSNWIAEGKLTVAALVGEGYSARILVEQADLDLARGLDPGQQAAQELPIVPPLTRPAAAESSEPSGPSSATIDDDLRRRRKAAADKAEHDAEAARRRLALDNGKWVDAAEAAAGMARIAGQVVTDCEAWLVDASAAMQAARPASERDFLHLLRREFHKLRERLSARSRAVAETLPATKEDADAEQT
jgi:hypothetical protein